MAVAQETGRAHVWIDGDVQNVNFRSATRDEAKRVGVHGWVKNLADGRVEAVFEGNRASVQRMVSWCYSGPSHATINAVEVTWEEATNHEGPFSIAW